MENIFVEFLPPWVETGLQPAFYDKESGSVLQQTARMYDRVNMLIRMFNKLSKETKETVEDYIGKFNELTQYVHDYFDNLDVQEEINNKLDAMTEAGTLQEIVADYLNSKAVFGFDTVSDLKSATNLIDGSYAHTLGFYNRNDGGDALYKIRKVTNDDVVDEKLIIEISSDPENELIAELVTDNKINICQIGGQQNFSSVCNYVLNTLNKDVYVPDGNYTATQTIEFTNPSSIFESDGDITFSTENSTLFSIKTSYTTIKSNGTLFVGNTNDALHVCDGNHNSYTNDVFIHRVSGCRNGIVINPNTTVGCQVSRFVFDRISCSNYGIYFNAGDDGAPWITTCNFIGGEISAPYGIVTRKGANQIDKYSDNSFYRITFSGEIECVLDLEYFQRNYIKESRIAEGLVGDYIIKLNECGYNVFENEYDIPIQKVNIISQTDVNAVDTFYAKCITDTGGVYCGYEGNLLKNEFIIPVSKLLRPERSYLEGKNGTDGTWEHVPDFYCEGMTVIVGSYTNEAQTINYTLPNAISKRGVKHFVLKVARQMSDSTIKLTDVDGHEINLPAGYLNNKYYKADIVNYGGAMDYTWKLTSFD